MELLKNRRFAVLITVVVAVAATLSGVYGTSNRCTRDIETLFYDGVYQENEGYKQPGIDSHLQNAANAALGLATIMEKYPQLEKQADQLIHTQRELINAISIGDKSSVNLEMYDQFYKLNYASGNTVPDIGLTERDRIAAARYYETFNGAQIAICTSLYNEKVMEYVNGQSFLIQIAGTFLPLKEPEPFSMPNLTAESFT